MTGPACIDESINQCALTAVGTKGYTGFGGEESVDLVVPAPSPARSGAPSPVVTTLAPSYPPAASPASSSLADAMCCYDTTCSTYGTSFCNPVLSWCSGSAEACEHCGGTLCVESAGASPIKVPSDTDSQLEPEEPVPKPEPETDAKSEPEPEPESAPEPAPKAEANSEPEAEPEPEPEVEAHSEPEPEPEPEEDRPLPTSLPSTHAPDGEAQCCYYEACSSYGTSSCNAAGSWCSKSSDACASCGGTLCTAVSLLSKTRAKSHKFLHRPGVSGNALFQTSTNLQKGEEVDPVRAFEDGEL